MAMLNNQMVLETNHVDDGFLMADVSLMADGQMQWVCSFWGPYCELEWTKRSWIEQKHSYEPRCLGGPMGYYGKP